MNHRLDDLDSLVVLPAEGVAVMPCSVCRDMIDMADMCRRPISGRQAIVCTRCAKAGIRGVA